MNYIKDTLIKSFKDFDKRIIFIVLYDLIFYSVFFICFLIFGKFLQKKAVILSTLPMEKLMELPESELNTILTQLQGFILTLVIGFLLIALIIFIAMCVFKLLIWLKTAKKEFKLAYLKKFILLNILWFLLWLIPIIIIFLFIKRELIAPLLLIIFILAVYFTNILYILFTEKRDISTIKNTFKLGFKKIYLFIIPYIIITILLLVTFQLYWLYKFTPQNIQSIITLIIILIYAAWARIYLYNVVSSIRK